MGFSAVRGAGETIDTAARARTGLLFFIARVAMLVALLGVPILGTSYALVSTVTDDVRSASAERADLAAYSLAIDLAGTIEAIRRDVVDNDVRGLARDRALAEALFVRLHGAYAGSDSAPFVRALRGRWEAIREHPTLPQIERLFGDFSDIGNTLDPNTLLDYDPNIAEQNAAAVMLRSLPRLIVAMSRTSAAARDASAERLSRGAISSLAAARAIEGEPQRQMDTFLDQAVVLDPKLQPVLTGPERDVRAGIGRFDRRVDGILQTFHGSPLNAERVERDARTAFDAQMALWRATTDAAHMLVRERYRTGVAKRRTIIALSLLAVILGTIALTFNIRSMARRDRIEIESTKLESERLRAELRRADAERALRLQAAQFQSVFENADLGIAIFEPTGEVREHNAALARMCGDRSAQLLAGRGSQVVSFENERQPFTVEEMHANADGSPQWLALTFSGVYDGGACQMVILIGRDVTEEKLFQQSLLHAANHDALTGIFNRAAFERELMKICGEGTPFSLFYIDLDRFKPINDRFGHAAGDAVLVATANRLRSSLATGDICVRLGGDEFAAIVRGNNDRSTLDRIAARVGGELAKPIDFGDASLDVTASIGIAVHRYEPNCCLHLKNESDTALYAVKERGGNGCRHADLGDVAAKAGSQPLVA